MDFILICISVFYVAMTAVTIWVMYKNRQVQYTIAKTLTSVGFLAVGLVGFLISGNPLYLALLPGYILCLVGDVLLALSHEIDDKLKNPQFTLGVAAFAAAHVCFIAQIGKLLQWKLSPWWVIFAVGLFAYTIWTSKSPKFEYGTNKIPSIIYAFVVGTLGGMGVNILCLNFFMPGIDRAYMILGWGCLFFMISDTILAHKFFKVSHGRWLGVGVLVFYYAAMYLISVFTVFMQ